MCARMGAAAIGKRLLSAPAASSFAYLRQRSLTCGVMTMTISRSRSTSSRGYETPVLSSNTPKRRYAAGPYPKASAYGSCIASSPCSFMADAARTAAGRSPKSLSRRYFSSDTPDSAEPVIDVEHLQNAIMRRAPEMSRGLSEQGYYTTTNFLPKSIISILRSQAVALRDKGRYEQSWSEKIVDGAAVRFDKEGVYACEPDGQDYYDAPDLIVYMSVLLQTLPMALNGEMPTADIDLSNSSFNAKLAVTSPGGSKYPLHIDNPQGLAVGDTRKLTCIMYLNPDYKTKDGGELRVFLSSKGDGGLKTVDLSPEGGRLLMFWSDEIPHEVLATAPHGANDDASLDRYALTVWIPTTNVAALHNESSKFRDLKHLAFP